MHHVIVFAIFFIINAVLSPGQDAPVDEVRTNSITEYSFEIQHSLNGEYSKRLVVNVKNDGKQLVEIEKSYFQDGEAESFRALLTKNELYHIRLKSTTPNTEPYYISAAIPSCELQRSGFKEDILLHLNKRSGNIIGMSYSSPVIAIPRPCDPDKVKAPVLIHTRVKIADYQYGQVVPLQATGQKPPVLNNVKLDIDELDQNRQKPKSFFERYWYLGIILAVYVLLGMFKEEPKRSESANK